MRHRTILSSDIAERMLSDTADYVQDIPPDPAEQVLSNNARNLS
jgi:hypothetical protein